MGQAPPYVLRRGCPGGAVRLLVLLLLAAVVTPAGAEVPGFARVDVGLPGDLDEAVVVTLPSGEKRVALLVDPPEPEAEEGAGESPDDEIDPDTDPEFDPEIGPGRAEDEDAPERLRILMLVDPVTGHAAILADDLPREVRQLGVLGRSGDGRERGDVLLLGSHDGLRVVDPSAEAPTGSGGTDDLTLERSGLSLRAVRGGRGTGLADAPAPAALPLARPGRLELLTAGADGGLAAAGELALPKRAERTPWGVRLTSPPVHRLVHQPPRPRAEPGPADAGPAPAEAQPTLANAGCWAVGPELFGKRRLRTLLHCADRPDAAADRDAEPVEAWSLLPEGETITRSHYASLRGRPMLVVLTRHKIGPFVKQRLRLFDLEESRNRVGSEPALAAQTECPLWRASTFGLRDMDGDGVEDLALVCVKGLVDQELRVEVYPGVETGRGGVRFDARARDLELDGEYSDWTAEEDWTGDGLPDLLAVHDGDLDLHPGVDHRRRPMERTAAGRIDLGGGDAGVVEVEVAAGEKREVTVGPGGRNEPEGLTIRARGGRILGVVDLNADGRPEVLVRRDGRRGDVLTVLSPR